MCTFHNSHVTAASQPGVLHLTSKAEPQRGWTFDDVPGFEWSFFSLTSWNNVCCFAGVGVCVLSQLRPWSHRSLPSTERCQQRDRMPIPPPPPPPPGPPPPPTFNGVSDQTEHTHSTSRCKGYITQPQKLWDYKVQLAKFIWKTDDRINFKQFQG